MGLHPRCQSGQGAGLWKVKHDACCHAVSAEQKLTHVLVGKVTLLLCLCLKTCVLYPRLCDFSHTCACSP